MSVARELLGIGDAGPVRDVKSIGDGFCGLSLRESCFKKTFSRGVKGGIHKSCICGLGALSYLSLELSLYEYCKAW
ncbi:hypothetical protein FF011L_03590 [Roseimaritima multifibrata]|uniref:Uncharacterized protein n=1 Tax=Roseimaritima multifibrata TaxID=1930274 RepID=A0A517M9Q6_9BACT|nr:hypothetical protein FF011L_03590 [Roseimaritima multifibrata]